MKLGIAHGRKLLVVIGLLKSSALGEGGYRNETYRDFEKTALHEIRLYYGTRRQPVWNIIY
jgi:hypothetical protein